MTFQSSCPSRRTRANVALWLAVLCACLMALPSFAIDTAPMTDPKLQFFDGNGDPLAGGCVFTYQAGTTTPQASYADYGGVTSNTNPVGLDAGGRASIWLTSSLYKVVLKSAGGINCASGSTIWTVDNVTNFGLRAQSLAVLLAPASGAMQTISGPLTATYFNASLAHTTSTGVRVGLLDATTILDTPTNPPNFLTVTPATSDLNYRVPDAGGHANFVLSPDSAQAGLNTLDCTDNTKLTCKRYALAVFGGGGCNNATAAIGWDTFGTNAPDAICVTGTNVQKGVMAMRSAATKYQENTNSAAAAGTCTVTYPQATIAGDFLVGWTMLDGTKTVTGVTDGTNAYTQAATVTSGVYRLSVYYFNGSSTAMAAASTLTFTFSAAANSVCGFIAYKDVKTAAALDVTATNTGSGTAVTTGTTVGTAQNTELILSFVGSASNPTVAFQSGTNGHTTVSQSTNVTGSSEGFISQATGTQAGTFTLGTANTWLSAIVAFKANVVSSTQAQQSLMVPPYYVSGLGINANILWQAPSAPTGTSTAVLGAQLVCSASGGTDDPTFNTATTSAITVPASAANTLGLTTLSNLSATGCSAKNALHFQLLRQRYNASDNYEGYIYVHSASLDVGVN
jgi:hypothetical protein